MPKRVNLRFATFFDYLRKTRRFHFEELHIPAIVGAPGGRACQKKPARELRQGGSDYRCCIPALAGFVSPQSIAPDGKGIFPQHPHHAIAFLQKRTGLTSRDASVCIDAVKWLALVVLFVLFAAANSCTTLVNRRDLYSPEPAPDSLEAMRQMTTVTTTTKIRREEIAPAGY